MAGTRILVVEDDTNLLATLKYNLEKEKYHVITAVDGSQALEVARRDNPDLIILDLMLPELSGYEVCRILRKDTTVPIIMLTAKTEEVDKIVGLEIGADDYMTKPFSMREFMARVRAMLRRVETKGTQTASEYEFLVFDHLQIDIDRHKIFLDGKEVDLTPKEFDLLAYLAKNRGIVMSRDRLLEKVWGYNFAGDTRTVDVHIRWLRRKIEENPARPRRIVTVRGAGYKLEG